MTKEPELKARDKVVLRMTRDGAVEENLTAGTEQRVSGRLEDAELVKPVETAAPSEALSAEELKKVRCAVNSVSFRRNTTRITTLSRPRKRPSQTRKTAENSTPECTRTAAFVRDAVQVSCFGAARRFSHTGTVIAETVVTHSCASLCG